MSKALEKLADIATQLDERNLLVEADAVDQLIRTAAQVKQAQYAGVQGWAIRNGRCWGNCYRQKRAQTPSKAAQEVWMECWDEYQKNLGKAGTSWDKYAESEDSLKMGVREERFAAAVQRRLANGEEIGEAVAAQLGHDTSLLSQKIIDVSAALLDVAQRLEPKYPILASSLVDANDTLLKEAGFWDKTRDMFHNIMPGQKGREMTRRQNDYNSLQEIEQHLGIEVQQQLNNDPGFATNRRAQEEFAIRFKRLYEQKGAFLKDPTLKASLTRMLMLPNLWKSIKDKVKAMQSQQSQATGQQAAAPAGPQGTGGYGGPAFDAASKQIQGLMQPYLDPATGKVTDVTKFQTEMKPKLEHWMDLLLSYNMNGVLPKPPAVAVTF